MKYDKTHAAVCGLYCPACSIYIATHEDPVRLKFIAKQFGLTEEEMKCNGCRSDKRIPYCDTCKLYPCAEEKGIDFCGECDEYPCDDIKEFARRESDRAVELASALSGQDIPSTRADQRLHNPIPLKTVEYPDLEQAGSMFYTRTEQKPVPLPYQTRVWQTLSYHRTYDRSFYRGRHHSARIGEPAL